MPNDSWLVRIRILDIRRQVIALCIALWAGFFCTHAHALLAGPFQIVGHIESFRLDPGLCPGEPTQFQGAVMTVNGQTIVVPCYSVLVMPARYLTPRQLFDLAPAIHVARGESGLALRDQPPPLAAFEATIDGNIVCTPECRHVAGQVHVSQQALNNGVGYIHAIDMTSGPGAGEMCVGSDPSATACQASDARVRLNDPCLDWDQTKPYPAACPVQKGRFGRPSAAQPAAGADENSKHNSRYPDHRFQVDQDNPTVHALTGYPMCVPRSMTDPLCPMGNRPIAAGAPLTSFVTGTTGLPAPAAGLPAIPPCGAGCDARQQAPLMVGDLIGYQGTLASRADPAAPADASRNLVYVSAHTVVANVGIYTRQSAGEPVYVTIEESLIGTFGNVEVLEPSALVCTRQMECQDRIKLEGFLSDPSAQIHVYALDAPRGAAPSIRLMGPAVKKAAGGVPFGRFRLIAQKSAGVLFDRNGATRGATREIVALVGAPGIRVGESKPMPSLPLVANGLMAGLFQAPVGEYIYPEPLAMGGPQPLLNFQCLAFLGAGWRLGDVDLKPLVPWPGSAATSPGISCKTPG